MRNGRLSAGTPLTGLKGIGPRRYEALSEAGLETVLDLLRVLPLRYEDRSRFARVGDLRRDGPPATLLVRVESSRVIRTRRRNFSIFEAVLADDSGSIRALWYNQPYLLRAFRPERIAVVFGRVRPDRHGKRTILENPDWEFLSCDEEDRIHTGRIVPVYRKVAGLSSRVQRSLIHGVLAELDRASLPDTLPADVVRRHDLLDRFEALQAVHFPPERTAPDLLEDRATKAHRTLAFEEMFLLQAALGLRRRNLRDFHVSRRYDIPGRLLDRLVRSVPFELTVAQRRVLREIAADLTGPGPMNRLLQGDVGSGKTVVAVLALRLALENGYQAVFMAPTEILAEQHHRNLETLLGENAGSVLLTGSTGAAQRRDLLLRLSTGEARIAVGTHALFEPGVRFHRLGLAVVDEQHRFGVAQRAALAAKGERPDILVMTATPIPRSLALTVYGDLDLSVLDEMPPGRGPVRTVVRTEAQRERVYRGIRDEVAGGGRAFIVVPVVEKSASGDLRAAKVLAKQLREKVFPDLDVGLLHGRMRGDEKEAVMADFRSGRLQVLVGTTVVEVGVDVPEATVMVVEHAERFGLSQLHQLRGRVGRGSRTSYCVLLAGGTGPGPEAAQRLAILETVDDGFRIAEKDLELRGPGAVFGREQHGPGDLQYLMFVMRDPGLLDEARAEAGAWVETAAGSREQAESLLSSLRPVWRRRLELGGTG